MEKNLFAVILAGGKGERFWPLSTSRRPKQLIPFIGRKSLLALAVERVQPLVGTERIIVVTGCDLVDAVRRELPQLPVENVIGEPFGRDTAAACGLGVLAVKARDPQAVMCILTADHLIGTLARFRSTLAASARVAVERGALVTIGLKPRSANTGYGYIQAGPLLRTFRGVEFRKALRFVEKPDQKTAAKYVLAGDFYWNSGMFIWTVHVIWEMLERHCSKLALGLRELEQFWGKPEFRSRLSSLYHKLERISVDYAVMEKAENVVMAVGTFAWEDVGTWPAFGRHLPKDRWNNAIMGICETIDSRNNVVVSEERLTALIGVEDLVVVSTPTVTVVCKKSKAQEIKQLVRLLERQKRKYGHLL